MAVASAGLIPTAQLSYTAPVVGKVAYSDASTVSHVYSSLSAPAELHYAAPVQKTIAYSAPTIQKTVYSSEPSHTLAYTAPAVYDAHNPPTYQHTHESVERSHDGTVSHYGKTLSTPHSHVQKVDTRITNDQYKLTAVPVVHKYEAAPVQYTQYSHAATPVQYSTPVQYQQYSHAAPVLAKTTISYSPANVVAHATFEGTNAHYAW